MVRRVLLSDFPSGRVNFLSEPSVRATHLRPATASAHQTATRLRLRAVHIRKRTQHFSSILSAPRSGP
jgi:hypothetical protein